MKITEQFYPKYLIYLWKRFFVSICKKAKTYQPVMACPYQHCCCHNEIQSRNVWLFCASWLFELRGHYTEVSLSQRELATQEKSSNSPVSSPLPDDQSTAASSKASSSGDTKLSNKAKSIGKETDTFSSQGTAQTSRQKFKVQLKQWVVKIVVT